MVQAPRIIHAIVERARSRPEQREGVAAELGKVARTHENEVHRTAAINALVLLFLDGTLDFELLPHLQKIDESQVRQALTEGGCEETLREAGLRMEPFNHAAAHIWGWFNRQMAFHRMHNEEEPLLDPVF